MRDLEKRFFPLLIGSLLCCACEGDTYDILEIDVPGGYELSAGTATVFMRSSKAYDTPANWVTGAYNSRFNNGDGLYDDVRTSTNGTGGGLGPVYAGYSCGNPFIDRLWIFKTHGILDVSHGAAYIESLSGLSLTRTICQQKRRPRRGVFPVPIMVSNADLDAQKRPFREYDGTDRAQTFAAVRRSAAASVCSHVNSGSSRPKWP